MGVQLGQVPSLYPRPYLITLRGYGGDQSQVGVLGCNICWRWFGGIFSRLLLGASSWDKFPLPFLFGARGSMPWQCQVPVGLHGNRRRALGLQGWAGATGKQPGAAALRQEAV